MKLNLGVVFGGSSVEHEVSIISALQAIDNIDTDKYEVIPIYISKDKSWYTGSSLLDISNYQDFDSLLNKVEKVVLVKNNEDFNLQRVDSLFKKVVNKLDVIMPIVHGQNVEDGTLAGYLETVGIPYVGSGVLGSSLGQDKVVMKQVFASENIPIVDYIWFYDKEYYVDKEMYLKKIEKLGYPVVVKPASLGSSIGINLVSSPLEIEKYIEEALEYDRKIVVEKAIDNLVEVNCSVIGNYENQKVSVLEQVLSSKDILTFKDKYLGNGKSKQASKGIVSTSRKIPADIDKSLVKKVETISKEVFKALNLSGVCRIDFLINEKTKEVFVNEPNTIPGSLAFYLWENSDYKYKDLLNEIIELGIHEYKKKKKKVTCFDSNILSNYKNNSGIKK